MAAKHRSSLERLRARQATLTKQLQEVEVSIEHEEKQLKDTLDSRKAFQEELDRCSGGDGATAPDAATAKSTPEQTVRSTKDKKEGKH